jgi:hypothetical protein
MPLAEHWNGTAWQIQSVPIPSGWGSGGLVALLNGVSCTPLGVCTAVGGGASNVLGGGTLAERWNGSAWQIESTPGLGSNSNFLDSVSCTSASACTSAGVTNELGPDGAVLAERWNGSAWMTQTAPEPATVYRFATLSGVSCPTSIACTTVGTYGTDFLQIGETLGETWNGSVWTIQGTPNVAVNMGDSNGLQAVSCVSAMTCTAVGFSPSGTLAESGNGTNWQIQTTPNPANPAGAGLSGVSCNSATACMAVGSANGAPLAERYF